MILLFLVSSCGEVSEDEFVCLPTNTNFSYPVDQWNSGKPASTPFSPDQYDWVQQSKSQLLGTPRFLLTSGESRLWMLGSKLWLYNTGTNEFKDYEIEWNNIKYQPDSIFMAQDGTIWTVGIQSDGFAPILSRYDEKNDKFVPVIDTKSELVFNGAVAGGMAEDLQGIFWIVLQGKGLYKFDPNNFLAVKIDSINFNANIVNGSIAVDRYGIVWLGTYTEDYHRFLYRYDPEHHIFSNLPLGISADNVVGSLLVDSEDRLWVGDYAFWNTGSPLPKEGSTGVNLLFRSPAFITQQAPFVDYYWARPEILFEDRLGNIWYSGYGLVFLNPKTGDWCKVFDGISNAVEDSDGRIWAVSDGNVYYHK